MFVFTHLNAILDTLMEPTPEEDFPIRINKYLARKGFSTRRGGDALVEKGMVLINGKTAVLGEFVREGDTVEVKGSEKPKTYTYYAYYKPVGVITHSPQNGEADIASLVGTHVFPVGRLDKDSHGLIILTDDGRITDRLLNPKYEHRKEYLVQTKEKVPSNLPRLFSKGIEIEGDKTKPCEAEIIDDHTFSVILSEGKKHQIRRMCAALNLEVTDLMRVRIENIKLKKMQPGELRKLEGKECGDFLERLGL